MTSSTQPDEIKTDSTTRNSAENATIGNPPATVGDAEAASIHPHERSMRQLGVAAGTESFGAELDSLYNEALAIQNEALAVQTTAAQQTDKSTDKE